MEAFVQGILNWVEANPTWALALVFLSSLTESLFLVGLLVPGAVLMFAAGAIVSTGALELMPTLVAAVSAAILGDGLSYWFGRAMRGRLHGIWPLSRYPRVIDQGESFFARHGGKSVILGRFVGAVRPIIPTVAGASGMRVTHFFVIDVIAALGWAPVYILPGVVFGASLGLAAEVAGRLVVVLLGAVAAIWIVVWTTQHVFLWFSRHTEELTLALLRWSQGHRRLGRLGTSLADPSQPETPGLAILALILLIIAWGVLTLLWHGSTEPPTLDALVYQQLQTLRTTGVDVVAVALSQLGNVGVYLPLTLAVLIGLISMQRYSAAAHWVAAIGFAAVVAIGISLSIDLPAPHDYYAGNEAHAYHGGHIVLATVIYAFIPVLLTSRLRIRRRWPYYGLFYSLITLITLSRLYLGSQWFSDTVLGLSLGLTWVALLTLGYRMHKPQRIPAAELLVIIVSALSAAAVIQWTLSLPEDLRRYQEELHGQVMSESEWRQEGYRRMPANVIDLARSGARPINLQWVGAREEIRTRLARHGWEQPVPVGIGSLMLLLTDTPDIATLPLLPQVHDGRAQALVMRKLIDEQSAWVLRLWPSRWSVSFDGGVIAPLWLGSVNRVTLGTSLPYLTLPGNSNHYNQALQELLPAAGPALSRRTGETGVPAADDEPAEWLLLISDAD